MDAAGRRGSVSEPDFEKNVPNGAHLLEGTGRILQRVASGTEGRSYRIELIHDSFCAPLADQKLKRAVRRRRRIIAALSAVALVVAAVAAYIIIMSVRNARQTREILIQQEKFYAKQASKLLDEGDTYTALLLLNELIDSTGDFKNIPLVPEAELQMRRALNMYDTAEWRVETVIRRGGMQYKGQFTPDGKYIVTSRYGLPMINIHNRKTNENHIINIDKLETDWKRGPYFRISNNGEYLVFINRERMDLYEIASGECIYHKDAPEGIEFVEPIIGFFEPIIFSPLNDHLFWMCWNENDESYYSCSLRMSDKQEDKTIPDKGIIRFINNDTIIIKVSGKSEPTFWINSQPISESIVEGELLPNGDVILQIGNRINSTNLYTGESRNIIVLPSYERRSIFALTDSSFMLCTGKQMEIYTTKGEKKYQYVCPFNGEVIKADYCRQDSSLLLMYEDMTVVLKRQDIHNMEREPIVVDRKENYYYQYFHLVRHDSLRVMTWGNSVRSNFEIYEHHANRLLYQDTNYDYIWSYVDPTEHYIMAAVNTRFRSKVRLFDLKAMKWIRDFDSTYWMQTFNSQGTSIYGLHNGDIVEVDIATQQERVVLPNCGDRTLVICIIGNDLICYKYDPNIYIFDVRSGKLKHTIDSIDPWETVFNAPKNLLLVSTWDGKLLLYDARTYKLMKEQPAPAALENISFSPDGNYFITIEDGGFRVWDALQLDVIVDFKDEVFPVGRSIVDFNGAGDSIWFYSDAIAIPDGLMGMIGAKFRTREEVRKQVRAIVGHRKLSKEEKFIIMK